MRQLQTGSTRQWSKRLPEIIFCLTVIINIVTTWYVVGHYLDSDASSEMVLAQHWIDTGNILSDDWIYGSEIRLFHMQLIYAPLLLIFDSWQTVRFLGAIIMQGIYLASYGYLLRQAGLGKKQFYLGGALLLLPVSVVYGRFILYHNHYLPNITISFFLVGMVLGFAREENYRSLSFWLRAAALLMLSFLGGLNSVRQLMITHVPLVALLVILYLVADAHSTAGDQTVFRKPERLRVLLAALLSAGASCVGLLGNIYLSHHVLWMSQNVNGYSLAFADAGEYSSILYGYFHQFGFREGTGLLSPVGVLSIAGLLPGGYAMVSGIRRLAAHRNTDSLPRAVVCCFFPFYSGVMLLVLTLTSTYSDNYLLYLCLCLPWAVPAMMEATVRPCPVLSGYWKKLLAVCSVLVLLFNSGANLVWFWDNDSFHQAYAGLIFQQPNHKAVMTPFAQYALENGYELGYAGHWECNILTEMTDGQLPMVNVTFDVHGSKTPGNLYYDNCLTSYWLREKPVQKAFYLCASGDWDLLHEGDSMEFCQLIFSDGGFDFFEITDLAQFRQSLYS